LQAQAAAAGAAAARIPPRMSAPASVPTSPAEEEDWACGDLFDNDAQLAIQLAAAAASTSPTSPAGAPAALPAGAACETAASSMLAQVFAANQAAANRKDAAMSAFGRKVRPSARDSPYGLLVDQATLTANLAEEALAATEGEDEIFVAQLAQTDNATQSAPGGCPATLPPASA